MLKKIIELNGINYPVRVKVENMNITLKDEYGKDLNAALKMEKK